MVFFILMTIRLAFITINRHQSKEKYIQWSCVFVKYDEENQASNSEMEAKDVKRKSIARLALMNVHDPEKQSTKFDDLLLVSDTALQCFKSVPDISCLWRPPGETFSIYTSLILCLIMGMCCFLPILIENRRPQ